MTWSLHGTHAKEGDLVELVGLSHKYFIFELKADSTLHTHRGVIAHNDLIGKSWGSQVFSHLGSPFFLLQPSLGDVIREMPRNSQILYPKDIGFILVQLGVGNGHQVIEAGSGSGAMTTALAYAVGAEGKVTSYDNRPDLQRVAVKNLERTGLTDRVVFKTRDIGEGFEETDVDAIFLDVPNPYDYIAQVRQALKPGGFFGCILPTVNQIEKLLIALRQHKFAFVDVCELMLRYYKSDPLRFRPVDRMVAHTGFLIFARPILPVTDTSETSPLLDEIEQGYSLA